MRTWVKCVLLVYVIGFIGVALTAYIFGIPEKPIPKGWSEVASDYRDNYLGSPAGFCVFAKSGMPASVYPKAVALILCASEKFANMTDNVVDLIDVRAIMVTYMVDKGYYPGTYVDGCAALKNWESACNVPYELNCTEVVNFINENHEALVTSIDSCLGE